MPESFNLDFCFAFGRPRGRADFRVNPEDFVVDEDLGFSPSGEGEHIFLWITKTSQNTHWLAQQLARYAKIKTMDVGYAGRKDRHAVTSQWFSLYLPGTTSIDWQDCEIPGVKIHSVTRHHQKLRPGHHRGNRFRILLRNVAQAEGLDERLASIKNGVPNYFGEQRFGRDGANLVDGDQWARKILIIRGKKQKGLIISALRSYLFNQVLSHRVGDQTWRYCLSGDRFDVESITENNIEHTIDSTVTSTIASTMAMPTGPLWGRGRPPVSGQTRALEAEVLAPFATWSEALEYCGLSQQRRPLLCRPRGFEWRYQGDELALSFSLGVGQYATSVLREIAILQNQSR